MAAMPVIMRGNGVPARSAVGSGGGDWRVACAVASSVTGTGVAARVAEAGTRSEVRA